MVAYDETAGVWEVYSDANCTKWLGAYDEYADAIKCLNRYLAA